MSYIFFSLVGKQEQGIITAIDCCLHKDNEKKFRGKLENVILLPSDKTVEQAQKVENYCISKI